MMEKEKKRKISMNNYTVKIKEKSFYETIRIILTSFLISMLMIFFPHFNYKLI